MKNVIVLTVKLLIITVVAGLVLGVINALTAAPIAAQEEKKATEAREAVFSEAAGFKEYTDAIPEKYGIIKNVYYALNEGEDVIGIVTGIKTKGFSPNLKMTVGISTDGKITGVVINSHEETPGLGANATKPSFTGQYQDVPYEPALVVVKRAPNESGEIQALTGATITTDAVTDAVNTAAAFYEEVIGGAK